MSMTPPPEHEGASAPPKKLSSRSLALVLGGIGCGLLILCGVFGAAVLLPVLAQARESAWTNGCMGNLRRLSTASLIYAADNDDHLPPPNWMDSISFDLQGGERTYHCPKVRSQENGGFGYAFSSDAIGKRTPSFHVPATQPMIFDSTLLQRNAVGPISSSPVPTRHTRGRSKGNNVAYVDGHVQLVTSETAR